MRSTERKYDIPVVFISSTVEDLKGYRTAASSVAVSAGFLLIMFEHWPAKDQRRPVAECLARVSSETDVVVVIVAHRYGWVPKPPDQAPNQFKSITWLECEKARDKEIELLAFLVDEGANWPDHLREDYRMTAAIRQGKATPALLTEVQRNLDLLAKFREWLEEGRIRATFKNEDEFQGKLGIALRDWRKRHPEFEPPSEEELAARGDPLHYVERLREATAWINLRGLQVESGKAHRFPIEQLYITLCPGPPVRPSRPRAPTDRREGESTTGATN